MRRCAQVQRGTASRLLAATAGHGVTLVELLVTLAVLAVLLGLAVPSFAHLMRENRLATASNGLLGTLLFARSEAIKRGHRVTACVSVDQEQCTAGRHWHQGWIVFADRNGNGVRDAGEALLRVGAGRADALTISGNMHVRNYVSYNGEGRTQLLGGGLQMGTVTLCDGVAARRLVINAVGRPRLEAGAC
jgi:type IV fimbrial biogenesis protein FimT